MDSVGVGMARHSSEIKCETVAMVFAGLDVDALCA
jgi:hypothetical protein